jgi:hypothetical protein
VRSRSGNFAGKQELGTVAGPVSGRELSGMESRDGGDKPEGLLAFFIFVFFFVSWTDRSRVPNAMSREFR